MDTVKAGLLELGLNASQVEQVVKFIENLRSSNQASWHRGAVGSEDSTIVRSASPALGADNNSPSSSSSSSLSVTESSSASSSSTSLATVVASPSSDGHACEEPARFLLSDEEAYSAKLRLLVNRYLEPLKKDRGKSLRKEKGSDEPSLLDKIFCNIEEILAVHRDLNGQLLEITFSRDWSQLGGIFARYISRMNCYARYIANYRRSHATLEALQEKRDKNKAVLNFLASVENEPDVMGLSLQMLLSCPLNRIAQYEVFLDRILISTPTSEPSYKDLLEAMALLSDLQNNITHELIEEERIEPIRVAERKIFGYPGGKLQAGSRVFLKEGLLSWFQDKKDRQYWMCLFSDKMLVCDAAPVTKKKNKLYKFRDEIPLQYITVDGSSPPAGKSSFHFEVVSGDISNSGVSNQTFRFSCPSDAERREWVDAFAGVSSSLVKTRLFGVELDEICSREGAAGVPPAFVATFIRQLNATALKTSGLYRVSGAAKQIGICREKLDRGLDLDFHDPELDDHTLSGLLKLFFREMPRPLLCPDSALFDRFLATIEDESKTTAQLRDLVESLPLNYRATAHALFAHLVQLAAHADVNMMTASNIAIVFGPNILRSSTADQLAQARSSGDICLVVEHLITHYTDIFPDSSSSSSSSSSNSQRVGSAPPPSLATPRVAPGSPAVRLPPPTLSSAAASSAPSSPSSSSPPSSPVAPLPAPVTSAANIPPPLSANIPPPLSRTDSRGPPVRPVRLAPPSSPLPPQ